MKHEPDYMHPQPGEVFRDRKVVWNWGSVIIYREDGCDRNDACTWAEWCNWYID